MPQFTPFLEQIQYLLDMDVYLEVFKGILCICCDPKLLTLKHIHILTSFLKLLLYFFNLKTKENKINKKQTKRKKLAKIKLLIPSVSMA